MFQTIFTKVVLHTKLFIAGILLLVSSHLGISHDTASVRATPTPTPVVTSTPRAVKQKVTTTPSSTPSYSDFQCPKIIKIADSLGNSGKFKKGEVSQLRLTVIAQDPQNLPLYYRFDSLGLNSSDRYSVTTKDWSLDNFVDINVTNAIPGERRHITVSIDNRDGYSCYGDYDIGEANFYDVLP